MPAGGRAAVLDAVGVTVARFLLLFLVTTVLALAGVDNFLVGLFGNLAITALAVWLTVRRGLVGSSGLLVPWRSALAAVLLLPLLLDGVTWTLWGGITEEEPGYALWATTLLLVGVNEELFSRVVILSRLEQAFRAAWAVTITAVLFGLQHLSALALTDRGLEDVAFNVLLSGVYGFALAVYQVRFRWVWPLIIIHALADFTTILAVEELPEWLIAVNHVGLLVFGLAVLRWVAPRALPRPVPA